MKPAYCQQVLDAELRRALAGVPQVVVAARSHFRPLHAPVVDVDEEDRYTPRPTFCGDG